MDEIELIREELSEPSRASWGHIVQHVMTIPNEEERMAVIAYVRPHLRDWPRSYCQINAWQVDEYWPLAKEVEIEGSSEEELEYCIAQIERFPHISSLIIRGFSGLRDLRFLERIPQIEHLIVEPSRALGGWREILLDGVEHCRKLRSLVVKRELLNDTLDSLVGLEQLTTLRLCIPSVGSIVPIKRCPLTTLELQHCRSLQSVAPLSTMKSVRELSLNFDSMQLYEYELLISIRCIRDLHLCSGLESLALSGLNELESLSGLSSLQSLKSLSLYRLGSYEESDMACLYRDYARIATLEQLEHLELWISQRAMLPHVRIPGSLRLMTLRFAHNYELLRWKDLSFLQKVPVIQLRGLREEYIDASLEAVHRIQISPYDYHDEYRLTFWSS